MTKQRDHQDKRDAVEPTSKTKSEERHDRGADNVKEQNESEAAPVPIKQSREDVNQAAFRIVRAATKD